VSTSTEGASLTHAKKPRMRGKCCISKESPRADRLTLFYRYYDIAIHRFYIRCTRCSAEITFKTDPKNTDYTCERGARRNFEMWRKEDEIEETDEQRLDRLDAEAQEQQERDAMGDLERKVNDAKLEMEIADKLDMFRTRNARIERGEKEGLDATVPVKEDRDLERERQDKEDQEMAKKAFMTAEGEQVRRLAGDEDAVEATEKEEEVEVQTVTFAKKPAKRKNNFSIPGLKKKIAA